MSGSRHKLKRIGRTMFPCFVPWVSGNVADLVLLVRMAANCVITSNRIGLNLGPDLAKYGRQ